MPFFLRRFLTSKTRVITLGAVAFSLVALLSGLFLLPQQLKGNLSAASEKGSTASIDLGLTYLPVTRGLSEYYGLGVDFGVLVTEVAPDSPSGRAGVKVGDVILSFNGVRVGEGVSLLGMIRSCPVGNSVMLEIWRGNSCRIVEIVHKGAGEEASSR